MNEQPNYYAILTSNVRYDLELKPNEKLLFAEITALSNKNGFCNASNGYFGDLYGVRKDTVSKWIKHLRDRGYLEVEIIRDEFKRIVGRKIYPIGEKANTLLDKNPRGIDKKAKGNNTSNNNTSNNKTIVEYEEIVNYLNEKSDKNYKSTTEKTRSFIRARTKEGFTIEDFKTVIDKKCKQWKDDPKMNRYLRPETLFSAKFEGYLNEEVSNGTYQRSNKEKEYQNLINPAGERYTPQARQAAKEDKELLRKLSDEGKL